MCLARFAKDREEGDTKPQKVGITQRFAKTDEGEFRNILELAMSVDLVPSKGEARKLIKASGLFVNKRQVTESFILTEEDFFETGTDWKFAVMRKGKTNHEIILI
jgi:tyrosyl-tRNA synthetase